MTPEQKHQVDQIQFELSQLSERVDGICTTMNTFILEMRTGLANLLGAKVVDARPASCTDSVHPASALPSSGRQHSAPEASCADSAHPALETELNLAAGLTTGQRR